MKILKLANLIVEAPDELSDVDDCEYTEFFIIEIRYRTVRLKAEPNYIHDVYGIDEFLDAENY